MTKTVQPDTALIEVVPPKLHDRQLEVLNDPHRMKGLRAGRRFRKSGVAVVQAFTGYEGVDRDGRPREYLGALTGGQIGFYVPSLTARYLVVDWFPIRGLAQQIPGTRIEEANHRVVLPSGGSIMMLSADNVDSGRGLGLDGVVVDEASLIDELLWSETIRATLIDREGWALLLWTPKGYRWPWSLEQEVLGDPEWRVFHFETTDNPHISRAELRSLTAGMSSLVYRQEILAEYVAGGAGMFSPEWHQRWFEAKDEDTGETIGYQLGPDVVVRFEDCRRFSTVDLAWSLEERADFTVISTWDVTPHKHLVLRDVVRGHFPGPKIVPALRGVYAKHEPGYFAVEEAARQLEIVKDAVRSGLPIKGRKVKGVKEARALPATARMEAKTVWFPPQRIAPAIGECELELYAFPVGEHDDFVDTFSLAVAEVAKPGAALLQL